MSLQFCRPEFVECPACAAKPGSPVLCRECLERRELYGVLKSIRGTMDICPSCNGTPNPNCATHGR